MTVEVGFVDGISAATTPIGTPISVTFVSSFSLKTPAVFYVLYGLPGNCAAELVL